MAVDCRYDVILGMTWNIDNKAIADYGKQVVKVNGRLITVPKALNRGCKVSNFGVKKFRSLLRKNSHKEDFKLSHIKGINSLTTEAIPDQTILPPYYVGKIMNSLEGMLRCSRKNFLQDYRLGVTWTSE